MLIVLQGSLGSGKTTLASAIGKLAGLDVVKSYLTLPDVKSDLKDKLICFDNIAVDEKTVSDLRKLGKEHNVIVTTIDNWPDGDYVIHLTPLLPSEMIPQQTILS